MGSLTPPSSPKTQRGGHRRILSDVTHSTVFGVPASKSTQLLQAAAAEASLNKSKSASTTPSGSPRTSQQNVYNPPDVSTWNPFDDDNFSKLTAEELLNKDFAKLSDGKPPEKLDSSTENLIPGFQPAPSTTQSDAFGSSSLAPISGLQGNPATYFTVNTEPDPGQGATSCLPLNKPLQSQSGAEADFFARDGLSSNSSFHSSEGEGTDQEGDLLDCSGSRPLLMDSEEEEEACKMNPQHQERGRVSQKYLNLQRAQNVPGQVLFNAFPPQPGEMSEETDVFATAPFRSSKTHCDDLDIFTKAPFLSRSQVFCKQLDEGDVFLKAPFTKKKSQEELASHNVVNEPPTTLAFVGSAGAAQCTCAPPFQTLGVGTHGSLLPHSQGSGASFAPPSSAAPCLARASEGPDARPPKGASGELGTIPSDTLQRDVLLQEGLLGSKTSPPFHPQSLTKYSRHYTPEGRQGASAQPIAAYKVVSQTNKQVITGSVSVASLSSRTLPTSDPFTSASFPPKLGKQKP